MRMRRLVTMSGRTSLTYHNIITAFYIKNTNNYDILCFVHFRFILDFLEFDKIVYVFADQIIKDHACCKMKQIVKYVIIVKIEPVAEGGKIL